MEPVDFTDEERAVLPPHEEVTFARNQPQYRPLPTVILDGREGRVISRWTLSPEERAAIAAGEDIYLEQLTFGNPLQPQRPSVGLRTYCPRDTM